MAAQMQVHETSQGIFLIARNFRVVQVQSNPEFRGSFALRRTVCEFWGRNCLWVRQAGAALTFATFANASEYLEVHQLELEVT